MLFRIAIGAYLSFALLFSSCQEVHCSKGVIGLDELSWLQGNWKMVTPDGVLNENWSVVNDTLWKAHSYMTASSTGDTVFQEFIDLQQSDTAIHYTATIPSQNNGNAIPFKASKLSRNEAVFENHSHDFPQRIVYKRTSDTSILAAIEGKEGGREKREEFSFTKE